MRRLSLFWKIYLSFLTIVFCAAFGVHVLDGWLENDAIDRAEAEFESRRSKLAVSTQEMVEELEQLLDRSASDDNREAILSWARQKKLDSGLDIYISLTDPDSPEHFSLSVQETGIRIVPPLAVMAHSASGRVMLYSTQEPYRDWDELRTPLPPKLFLLVALVGAVIGYFVVRHLMVPLRELERATTRVAQGDFSARVDDAVLAGGGEMRRLGAAFNVMAGQVERLLENQRRLLSDISHEVRSPLQRLTLALALIEAKGGGHVDATYLEQAKRDVRRIDMMVEELLLLMLTESPEDVEMERVAMKNLLVSLLDVEKFEWSEGARSVVFQGESVEVLGNAKLLSRAMRNLVHNALRYSPEGGKIEVSLVQEGTEAVLRVRDHGNGVAEEELEKIFLPFYRTESARERVSGGTGLGLSIVRRVAEEHGGSCVAEKAPGGGLLMVFRLPLFDREDVVSVQNQ